MKVSLGGNLECYGWLESFVHAYGFEGVVCVMKTFTWRPFGTFGQELAFAAPNLGTWMMMMIRSAHHF